MNTRRYPRTLEEAFGPYQRGPIYEPKQRMQWQDKVVLAGSAIAAIVLAILAVWGRL